MRILRYNTIKTFRHQLSPMNYLVSLTERQRYCRAYNLAVDMRRAWQGIVGIPLTRDVVESLSSRGHRIYDLGCMVHTHQHTSPTSPTRFPKRLRMHRNLLVRLREAERRPGLVLLIALLIGVIFGVDLLLPLGIAGGVPYVAPVLVAMWLSDRRFVIPTAMVCSFLTVVGFLLSSPGAPFWAVIPNRILAILAVWTVALLLLERKRIEEALAESEATTRAVLATTADGILALDGEGRIVSVNPAAERIFGYAEAELVSQPLSVLLGPADKAPFEQDASAYLQAVSSETTAMHEVVGQRKEGTAFPLELVLVPHAMEAGTRYTATVRDISERRLLEQHLLRATEEERQVIGYGLHEELGQSLTGLNLISRHLAHRLEDQQAVEAHEAADLAALLHEADALALRLFETLVPVQAKGGLPEALSQLVHEAAGQHGVPCTVELGDMIPPVNELHATQLYRIVQDLVDWSLHRGRVHHITLQIGSSDDDNILAVRLQGSTLPDDEWTEVVQRLTYRTRLIGARIRVCSPEEQELLVTCSF